MEIDHTEQPEHALPSFSIIIETENLAWHRDAESLLRLVSEYTYKPLRRLPALLADNPKCIVYLPLATVMIVYFLGLSLTGYFLSLVNADSVLQMGKSKLLDVTSYKRDKPINHAQ